MHHAIASMLIRTALLFLLLSTSAFSVEPVRIFFDTDMDTDCDDAGALAVLHALADRGECQILATVVSVRHPGAAPTVAAINSYYGRADLPIGGIKSGGVLEPSPFADKVAAEFPQPLKSTADAPEALAIYRDVLEKQPDQSVVIVTVGYLTNLRRLLELPAEGVHPSGAALIQRKVKHYVCMGGNFIGTPPKDDLKLGNVNFQRDPESALHVVKSWPTPITFVGREIGSVPSGLTLGSSLAKTPATNPVRRAYEHYFGGSLKNRHVADLVTVLYAVRGLRDYWNIETKGHMDLRSDMTFAWSNTEDRRQSYLLKKRDAQGQPNDRYIESVLDQLLTQSPRR
jgi:inosine-uridine nucleoside N-ribohydrolase